MRRFALMNILLALVVITLGALTRLMDAGLGCPDWPACYGHFIPKHNEAAMGFTLWEFDSVKAWMEMIHRYAASILGLTIIIQAILLFPRYLGTVRWLAVFLVGWVILQGMFGMWTVTWRLWPPVVSAHLLGGAITLGAQFLIWRSITSNRDPNWFSPWSAFALVVFLQMALGAWTSSQYAGLACPDFPTCQGQWWIEIDEGVLHAPKVEGDEYLGGILPMQDRMAIQWLHRLGAIAVLVMFAYLWWRESQHKKALAFVSVFLAVQVVLGVLNAVLLLPLSLALLHNTFAMLLLISVLNGFVFRTEEKDEEVIAEEMLA
ncbi:heme A synthase [Bermanella marisrubri]|uniref:Cytochrome oxidase assembly protein n=1 Tax=Bermanella marisrubri TaxID=207949 RepID=Q1N2N0_9GAMM|nr:COX15/CtaA family protein [Bermanella marisrubri]EAT12377.1 cytochrome oxidase assembly protein [Oceanobacter sp. RED65] [Bermanella marisrubri]QIZ85460.1 heme A synthase [Bermanella marisrubri]